jgi:hypothetical protein
VNKAAAKYDQMRLTAFLDAAARGDVDGVQDMLRQGMDANSADYGACCAVCVCACARHAMVMMSAVC